jgi:hypothetical protein
MSHLLGINAQIPVHAIVDPSKTLRFLRGRRLGWQP